MFVTRRCAFWTEWSSDFSAVGRRVRELITQAGYLAYLFGIITSQRFPGSRLDILFSKHLRNTQLITNFNNIFSRKKSGMAVFALLEPGKQESELDKANKNSRLENLHWILRLTSHL